MKKFLFKSSLPEAVVVSPAFPFLSVALRQYLTFIHFRDLGVKTIPSVRLHLLISYHLPALVQSHRRLTYRPGSE